MSNNKVKATIKSLLGDSNQDSYQKWEDRWLSHHDLSHMELSELSPIDICGYKVTGINGVSIPEFGTQDRTPDYDGYFDECRVALYQLIKYPTYCGIFRAIYWLGWLIIKKENPLKVLYHQWKSM